jgi:3-oxoacyl-[acyl-carrier protein] reductase
MAAASEPLSGRVALVTGGSRGLGRAICAELAAAGATLAINYRGDEQAARESAAALGNGAGIWQADISDRLEAAAMVEGVLARHGRLDLLVLNAGVWRGGRIDSLDPDDWDAVIDTSLTGAFNVLRAASGPLAASDAGRVVVLSSAIALVGFAGDSAYGAAKAGLVGLVRSLAKELGADGVTVNAVAPGFIHTDMTAEVPERSRERMLRRTALRRFGDPEDVAKAVRFLAVDGGYVTGQTLTVDGGFSL